MQWDDDDDHELEVAFEWAEAHSLQELAWNAAMGRLMGVPILLGFQLIDAIKAGELSDMECVPYVAALSAAQSQGRPAWD